MVIGEILQRFIKSSPVTVMSRAVLEFSFPDEVLDRLFQQSADRQYEDKLLFSTVVKAMSLVVSRSRPSVRQAYLAMREEFTVSLQALYDKMHHTEPAVCDALVRESFLRMQPLRRKVQADHKRLFPGYVTKILDGAHLGATQHRLQPTRVLNSAPLPGQALVVLEPDDRLISHAFACEDAYAQERSLLDAVLATLERKDLMIADRNFCTTGFLFGLARRGAAFIIRQHASTLSGKKLLGKRKHLGRSERGEIYEQRLWIIDPLTGEELVLRRVTIELDEPTVDGEREIHLLSNLPPRFTGLRLAAAYLQRWRIENAFQEIEQALRSEVNTLGYPRAALLGFAVGLLMYNVLSVVKEAIQSQHGKETAACDDLSGYCLASEVASVHDGLMIAVPAVEWTATFSGCTATQMARFLCSTAAHVDPQRFRKSPRGPKKPRPPRTGGLREKHVSTHRLLAKQRPAMPAARP